MNDVAPATVRRSGRAASTEWTNASSGRSVVANQPPTSGSDAASATAVSAARDSTHQNDPLT